MHAMYEVKDFVLTYTVKFNSGRWLDGRPNAGIDENTLVNSIADQVMASTGFLFATHVNITSYVFVIVYFVVVVFLLIDREKHGLNMLTTAND